MKKGKKLVIFDFDGVFINTADMSFEINLKTNPHMTREEYNELSEGNFHHNLEKGVASGKFKMPDHDEFFSEYNTGIMQISVIDILHDAVLHLNDKYILAIVSSSSSSVLIDFMKKENLFECFSDILGYEVHKSKVVKINNLLEKHRLTASNAIFITDTLGDLHEANECGVEAIAVTWGMHKRETLEQANPYMILDHPNDLVPEIEKYLTVV
jgi:phosphoglycolate phosphatase